MRDNNHIINRNSYQDVSSYKIREPVENTFYPNRGKQHQDHGPQENNIKSSKIPLPPNPHDGYYLNPPKKPTSVYEDRSQNPSRDQSKGSNMSRNSIKISQMVALQARNILQNKQKFKYEEQVNHARRSSMQYYPKTGMKMNNSKHQLSSEKKNQVQQPCEIPSFGAECRSTMSAYDKPPLPHSTSSYYHPSTSHTHSKDPTPFQLRNQRLKSQIDQRIQRLKISSNSTSQHKQRLSSIKVLDANRIESMDKINIKIKSILKTLQSEEDQYNKRKVTTEGNEDGSGKDEMTSKRRLRTGVDDDDRGREQQRERSFKKDNKPYYHSQIPDTNNKSYHPQRRQLFSNSSNQQLIKQASLPAMNSNTDNSKIYRNHSYNHQPYQYHQQKQLQKTATQNNFHDGINVQSYYYYGDQEAMLKSAQSLMETSPEKGFGKKWSVGKYQGDKQENRSIEKRYQTKDAIGSYKLTYPSQLQSKPPSQKPPNKPPSSLSPSYQQQRDYSYRAGNFSSLNNIPQCQTQIVDSKTFQNTNNIYGFQSNNQQQYDQDYASKIRGADGVISVLEGMYGCVKLTETIAMESKRKHHSVYLKTKNDDQKVIPNAYDNPNEYKKIDHKPSQQQLSQQYPPVPIPNQQSSTKFAQPNYFYSDSIKQTPRISQRSDRTHQQNEYAQQKPSYQKRSQSCSQKQQQSDQLQNKLKSYQQRIQNYNREISASKLLDVSRSKSYNNIQKSLSNRSLLNIDDKPISNNNISTVSERILEDVKRQRTTRVNDGKPPRQPLSRERESKSGLESKQKKPKSPRPSHRFAKQDHQKLIDSLRKQRQQVAASLSKRKSVVDLSRLSPSPFHRSQSNNSRISSVTIIKGKNVDEQIQKLQKKIEQNKQLRRQIEMEESQQRVQRSTSQIRTDASQMGKGQQPRSVQKGYEVRQKSPKAQKRVRFDESSLSKRQVNKRQSTTQPPLSTNTISSTQRRQQLMKIVTEQNSYVKVRNSIIKQHKTTQLKNYLNEELERQANLIKNKDKTQSIFLQKKTPTTSQLKENVIPTSSNSARSNGSQDYSKHSNGQKKSILGLATNLVNYHHQHQKSHVRLSGEIEDDVGTPKLLRNLKHKAPEKSIVKKRAQKRGFRSQFINNLHEENEILYSAKKNEQQLDDPHSSTSRLQPELEWGYD